MRSPVSTKSFALALVAVTAVACAAPKTGPDATAAAVPVATEEAAAVDWISRYEAGGTLTARDTALISSRIVAPISAVMVRPGDTVTPGQTLLVLETAELAAQASRAAAALDAARQAGDAAKADAKSAEAAVVLTRAAMPACILVNALRTPPRSSGVPPCIRINVAICSMFACLPLLAAWNITT